MNKKIKYRESKYSPFAKNLSSLTQKKKKIIFSLRKKKNKKEKEKI